MIPTPRCAAWLVAAAILLSSVSALAQPGVQEERVAASFMLALGRVPTPAEAAEWTALGPRPIADLLERHARRLQTDAAAAKTVAFKAGIDALGRAPRASDPEAGPSAVTYFDLVQRHLARLAGQPAEYEQVLNRAYRLVLHRDAYSVEVDYWKRSPVLSAALLAACIEDWARRNQPGLMATAGVPSASVNNAFLATVRLSPAVAAEARAAVGLAAEGGRAQAAATGRAIVAPGAGAVTSVGGIPFAAAGSDRMAPPI